MKMKKKMIIYALIAAVLVTFMPGMQIRAESPKPEIQIISHVYYIGEFICPHLYRSGKNVKWTTSDSKVAKYDCTSYSRDVGSSGFFIAQKPGNVKLTASYKGRQYSVYVTVKDPVMKIKKGCKTILLAEGQKLAGSNAELEEFFTTEAPYTSAYNVLNVSKIKIADTGILSKKYVAKKKGTTTMTISYPGKTLTIKIKVLGDDDILDVEEASEKVLRLTNTTDKYIIVTNRNTGIEYYLDEFLAAPGEHFYFPRQQKDDYEIQILRKKPEEVEGIYHSAERAGLSLEKEKKEWAPYYRENEDEDFYENVNGLTFKNTSGKDHLFKITCIIRDSGGDIIGCEENSLNLGKGRSGIIYFCGHDYYGDKYRTQGDDELYVEIFQVIVMPYY